MSGPDPLRHHGDAEVRTGLVDFAVNVAVPAPPPWLATAIGDAVDGLAAYPDEGPARRALAAHHGVDPDRVLLVNGAAEAFTLLARARRWRRPLVVHPQFTEPEAALAAAGHRVERHLLGPAGGFRLHPADIDAAADLVVVGNPTNPTSRLHRAADLLALAGPAHRTGRVLVVDEAFMDVVAGPAPSLLPAAGRTPGIVVVRSLTKTYGLAGLRAGYLVGDPKVLAACRAAQPPWSVNALALAAVQACLSARGLDHVRAVAVRLAAHRPRLVAGLTDVGLDVVAEPAGPFVLARHPRAARLRDRLRERGYAVRRGDTFPGLDDTWVRLAVRPPALVDALIAQIGRILGADGGEDACRA